MYKLNVKTRSCDNFVRPNLHNQLADTTSILTYHKLWRFCDKKTTYISMFSIMNGNKLKDLEWHPPDCELPGRVVSRTIWVSWPLTFDIAWMLHVSMERSTVCQLQSSSAPTHLPNLAFCWVASRLMSNACFSFNRVLPELRCQFPGGALAAN